jgi:hypothetical protein
MFSRKVFGTVIAAVVLVGVPMALASNAVAASNTSGLVALSLQGVGSGTIAQGDCQGIACKTPTTCACLTATYTLVGNQGFAKGSVNLVLSLDATATSLPISNIDSCFPATGTGTIKNSKGTIQLSFDASGIECPTVGDAPDVFNGTYVITSGSGGKFSTATGGTGTINGSQVNASGGTSQLLIAGSLQASVPLGPTPTPTPIGSPTPTPIGSPTPTPTATPSPTPTATAT